MSLILSVNAGSSSLKISLYDASDLALILTASFASISTPPASFSFQLPEPKSDSPPLKQSLHDVSSHDAAFAYFLDQLHTHASIHPDRISHVCHRVVHGGDYPAPVIINDESYHHIETLSDLAPLHNAAALSVIKACIKDLPSARSVAYFDTAFHRSIPRHISAYAIDQKIARAMGLKKYGFHGLSYTFILHTVAEFLDKPPSSLNLLVLHLGSGASLCAIHKGCSYDTSMGLTPLAGLPGATRAGSVDPSLIFHYANTEGDDTEEPGHMSQARPMRSMRVAEAEEILNRRSGWLAMAGTADFRKLTERASSTQVDADADADAARLAFDLFADRVLNFVGAYFLKLAQFAAPGSRAGGIDALVFSGGVGEHSAALRAAVAHAVGVLGFEGLDEGVNEGVEGVQGVVIDVGSVDVSAKDDRVERKGRLLVCRTDEQLEMARECVKEPAFWD